jgi:hypothetical protein
MVVVLLINHDPRMLPAVAPNEWLDIRSLYIFPNIVAHEAEYLATASNVTAPQTRWTGHMRFLLEAESAH